MTTAIDIRKKIEDGVLCVAQVTSLTPDVKARSIGPIFNNREDMVFAISGVLRKMRIPHSPAQYDGAGNCLTCGECERCPGVHTFEEIQQAARKDRVTA